MTDEYTDEQQALDAVTMAEGERRHIDGFVEDDFPVAAFSDGAEWGAGWAFAIVGNIALDTDRVRLEAELDQKLAGMLLGCVTEQ